MKPVIKLVIAILPVLLLIGCGSKEVKEEPSATEDSRVVVDGGASTAGASEGERLGDELAGQGAAVEEAPAEEVPTEPARDLLSERKIYFDFDKSDIKDEFREVLQAHAEFLVSNPSASLVIEGHCDERGTREYNMALGERRAHSVFQYLTLQGVGKNQVRTVSFGEERPDVEGHDESAWKWNRRAVFVYAE
jgi:peptidoglycan-associated lipoprotein